MVYSKEMNVLRRWLPLAILTTCLSGLMYVAVQQTLRLSANDPQIQLAEDTALKLTTQDDTVQITSLPKIDIAKSLSPFVIIYDASGKVVSATGDIEGETPEVPMGVFAYTKEHREDRFTWQPRQGVRIAAVMRHYSGRTTGYVLAGRSLREVEKREDRLMRQVGLMWVVTLAATLIGVLVTSTSEKRKK